MFWFDNDTINKTESEEATPCEPKLEDTIHVTYSLRNGKSWDFTITYTNSDYHNYESYEEANAAMKTDVANKVDEIVAAVQENLGKETGCIHLGNTYIANRDLATVNLYTSSHKYNGIPW